MAFGFAFAQSMAQSVWRQVAGGGLPPVKLGELVVDLWPPGGVIDEACIEIGVVDEEEPVSVVVQIGYARALAEVLTIFATEAERMAAG